TTTKTVSLKENKIVFNTSHEEHFTMPCIQITQSDWDDFTYKTTVRLEYLVSVDLTIYFGYPKIMRKGISQKQKIIDLLPKSFIDLSDEYCSLCVEEDYISN